MGWIIAVIVIVLVGLIALFGAGYDADTKYCQQTYGIDYQVGWKNNSSIRWCQNSKGDMKALNN